MENDYRITKFHGTLIGDNRIPDIPDSETAKILSSANGKTAWVDLPTDVGKDANGFAVLRHDGVEIAGQRKTVKLADVRENGAVIGRDQTTSAPQTDELITKAYADKSYVQINKDNRFEQGGIEFGLNAKLRTEDIYGGTNDGSGIVTITPSGEAGSGTISFVSAGNRVLSNGSTILTGMYFNTADICGGGNLSALNPSWKSIYGIVSAFQSQWNLAQGGFEALGFTNSKTANERETAPNPSRLTFFSPIGTVSYYDLAGNAQYDYQLPKKSGTIALTSDLSEAGTSVTIRRW